MPRFLVLVLCLFALVVSSLGRVDTQWDEWKKKYSKEYRNAREDRRRFAIWNGNRIKIEQRNKEGNSYRLAVNKFADLTEEEFRHRIHGSGGSCLKQFDDFVDKHKMQIVNPGMDMDYDDLPESVDWANGTQYVNPIKDQGDCGSCWAFSAVGSTESRYAIATGTLNSLSEQELVDCSDAYGNAGCDGGDMDPSFEYIKVNDGLSLESAYEYKGRDGTCQKSEHTHYDPVSGFEIVERDNATALMAALVHGPVSIGIEADQTSFTYYDGGVLDGKCGTQIDHGVVAVGYGVDETTGAKYWKVRNSWGTDWGEDGYVRICRECDKNDGEGECCILCQPSYPIISA